MEEILKTQLEPGERILWLGHPVKGGLDQKNVLVRWIIFAVSLAIAAGLIVFTMGLDDFAELGVATASVVAVLPFLYAVQPILDQHMLEKETVYAITDQRVISVVNDTVRFLPKENLEWKVSAREGGVGSIRLGGALYNKKKNDQIDAVTGIAVNKERPAGMVLYRIDQVDTVCGLL